MLNEEKKRLIEQFLAGAMDEQELIAFQQQLSTDVDLRTALDREAGVEGLLCSMPTDGADVRYSAAINRTIAVSELQDRVKENRPLQIYALAATLLLLLLGGYSMLQPQKAASRLHRTAAANAHYRTVPQNGKSITRLSQQALLVSEEGTKARVTADSGNGISVIFAQGNAVLDITDSNRTAISIVTPHGIIICDKAMVCNVVVTELETEVTVLAGSIEAAHRNDPATSILLTTGSVGYADYTALQVVEPLTMALCKQRTVLLRAYIAWVQQQAHGVS